MRCVNPQHKQVYGLKKELPVGIAKREQRNADALILHERFAHDLPVRIRDEITKLQDFRFRDVP